MIQLENPNLFYKKGKGDSSEKYRKFLQVKRKRPGIGRCGPEGGAEGRGGRFFFSVSSQFQIGDWDVTSCSIEEEDEEEEERSYK